MKRGTILRACADLTTRRPWLVIAVWGAVILVMGVAGLNAKQVLKPEDLVIGGTPSAGAIELERGTFGHSTPVSVMLEGRPDDLDISGPRAAQALDAIKGVSVSSPWSPGAPKLLHETRDRALLIVTIDKDLFDAGNDTLPLIEKRLDQSLPASVHAYVAGQARFETELVDLVFSGAQKAELVALPFLLLILLLIFRAPIAACLPLLQGVAVIVLTTGLVTLIGRIASVNVLAQASGSIIGLALGVDYSLLFVSRFRDELAAGKAVDVAVGNSLDTMGRTVAFAGGILALAGLLVIATTVGWASMATGSIGVVAAAMFSVLAAFTLLPASLALLGENINRWPIGAIRRSSALAPLVNRLIARPVAASLIVLIPLLFLCANALSLVTGGPSLKLFKGDNPMRQDVEAVAAAYGGGVMSPYEVVVKSPSGPITSPAAVRSLERFQRSVAADPAVKYVVGPGTARVRNVSDSAERGPTQLAKFEYGLGAASTGIRDLRKGLGRGARSAGAIASANNSALLGARQLQSGFNAAASGASALSSGLDRSASGSKKLDAALNQLSSGAAKLRDATREASREARGLATGAGTLKSQLNQANNQLANAGAPSQSAASALSSAKASLDSMSPGAKAESNYQSAYQSVESAQNELSSQGSLDSLIFKYNAIANAFDLGVRQANDAANGAARLSSAVGRLSGGVDTVAKSTGQLSSGLSQLSNGTGKLSNGLGPLQNGAAALSNGLSQLGSGSGQLGAGLSSGYKNSAGLSSGLRALHSSVASVRKPSSRPVDLKRVARSAYLTMALLSAASPAEKQNLRLVLNEQNGGDAARIFMFTHAYPTDKTVRPFAGRLGKDAALLAKSTGATVAVGGPGQSFLDYDKFTHSRILPLILVLSLMSFLFLLLAFRSVLLAAKAVILNMITVGAAMGLIHILFDGKDPLLGGPGWMEATSFFVVYSTTFALSMDYEIFMISRMRESYLRSGSNETAIREGVTKTAGIITGSAAVMTVLFLAMAFTSELVSNAQMGLGLAIAITIDATVVRLLLLPATMRLFGDANWWLPAWLDRLLPNVAIH